MVVSVAGCTIPRSTDAAQPSSTAITPTSPEVLRPVETAPGSVVASAPVRPTPPGLSSAAQPAGSLAGRTVFLDPGHNASADPAYNGVQVPTGRGGTKDCQTSGTSTDSGYPEHTFNFDVALRVQQALSARGARVLLTRSDDTGAGPCIDARAAAENASGADVVVSIHADGAAPSGRGFHVAYSAPPLNSVQSGPAVQLATTMRDALVEHGYTPSTYLGDDGLNPRDDLAGLNLAEQPSVLVECANMRNPAEAAVLSNPDGRQGYADGITDGIARFLGAG